MAASNHPLGFRPGQTRLEAEVHPNRLGSFQTQYLNATGQRVDFGNPPELQEQPNKWGAELRIYFNASSQTVADLVANGFHVTRPTAYGDQFQYRINNNELWWDLVENHGYELADN